VGGDAPTLEAGNAAGVTPAARTQWLDLWQFGYNPDKPDVIGQFPNGDLAVQDDNDFGFAQGNDPAGAAAGLPGRPCSHAALGSGSASGTG